MYGKRGASFSGVNKRYEEHLGNNIDEVLDSIEDREILGEITIVIKGVINNYQDNEFNRDELKKELNELIREGLTLSAASRYLAKKNNLRKNLIYSLY